MRGTHVVMTGIPFAAIALVIVAVAATVRGQSGVFSEGDAYERFMGRWSARMAPELVRWAGVRDGEVVLDVGSGTGALAAAVVTAAPSSRVTGIDPAGAYVAFAQGRGLGDRVRFEVGDAQHLGYADRSFDRTLSLLVLNFIPDADRALAEMIRVTRHGGTVAAAIWDYGDGMEMLRVFWDEAIALDPGMEPRDERRMPLCRKGELAALWRAHRLQDVVESDLTIETRFSSFDDYWAPFLGGQGPAGSHTTGLADENRVLLCERLRRRLLAGRPDGPITLRARAWVVRGTVPVDRRRSTSAATSIVAGRLRGRQQGARGNIARAVVFDVHMPVVAGHLPEHTVASTPERL